MKIVRSLAAIAAWLSLSLGANAAGTLPTPNFGGLSINGAAVRIPVNAAQSFYVNPNTGATSACGPAGALTCQAGSDVTGTGTLAAPFATLRNAITVIQAGYDFRSQNPTIYLAHGTDPGNVQCHTGGANVGRVVIFIDGDSSAPTATIIQAPNSGEAIQVKDYCALSLVDLTISDQGTSTTGLHVLQDGIMDLNDVHFLAFNANAFQIQEEMSGASMNLVGPIYLDGGAKSFLKIQDGASFHFATTPPLVPQTVNIANAIAYTNFVAAIGPASLTGLTATTFQGAGVAGTTGRRAALIGPVYIQGNAVSINSIFPGNSNATLTQGAGDDGVDALTTQLPVASGGTGTGAAGATAVGNISAATPVSCPAGVTAATVVVLNGIITHC